MSGIAGVVHGDGRDVSRDVLHSMAAAASVRADDGIAFWADGPAGLIRFRHATTPEALGERQPHPAASGLVIVFNGRIDNRADLIALLGATGEALRHRPDEEIVVALFERFGDDAIPHLAGEFAFRALAPRPAALVVRAVAGRATAVPLHADRGIALPSRPSRRRLSSACRWNGGSTNR